MTPPTGGDERPFRTIWRPDQYLGEPEAHVAATQLDTRVSSAAERRRILTEWITFFSAATIPLTRLHLVSRVPQDLLDALAGQPQLIELELKWGPYRTVDALRAHDRLQLLRLGGATSLQSLAPLTGLPKLTELGVGQAHRLDDPASLAAFTGLTSLEFGDGYAGSDRSVVLPDLRWVRSLTQLRRLALPGTRILDPDLSPLLELTELEQLRLPLRRQYRRQVLDFARTSPLFAQVAAEYAALDRRRPA